ncbi:hypothetical protein WKI68_20645 [Streptomyces sp. MS1.HAVA.3]|uniref:Bifunctional 3'-5' exonuclease/DNA polymerase n=1 Tax=Streptomyces caledonius TaxID=3134107 RepID=A0ABU8U5H9_9ACTN
MSDRTSRWALAEDGDGWWHAAPVHPAAGPGARMRVRDPAEAVRAAPPGTRWVWRSTAAVYPRLLAAGARVERCHDIEDAELLLLGHEGRSGEPRSAAAAWARLNNAPVPPDPPQRAIDPRAQDSLFDPRPTTPVPWTPCSPSTPTRRDGSTPPPTPTGCGCSPPPSPRPSSSPPR